MEQGEFYRFQSEFLYDRNINRELVQGAEDVHWLNMAKRVIVISLLSYSFASNVLLHDHRDIYSQIMVLLGAFLLLLAGLRTLTRLSGGVHYKRALTINGGEPPVCTVQFFDGYVLDLNKKRNDRRQLDYSQFRGVIETKNLLLLSMKHSIYLMVDKRTLTGDSGTFLEFLFLKCDNIRRKRVRSTKPGRTLRLLEVLAVLITMAAAVALHPRLDLEHRLSDQIHNGMSGSEIVNRLKDVGISGIAPEEAEVSADLWNMGLFAESSKLEDLLYYPTMGVWDEELELMAPGPINYGFCCYWADEEQTMYTQLLHKLDAMSDAIDITDIQENAILTDGEIVSGDVTFSFTLNGTAHTIEAAYNYDLYDPQVFSALSAIIEDSTGKRLYFRDYQTFGVWLFLGDPGWAEDFQNATGWKLSDDYYEVCPDYLINHS